MAINLRSIYSNLYVDQLMAKITISFNIFKMILVMIEYYHIVENDHKLRIRKR